MPLGQCSSANSRTYTYTHIHGDVKNLSSNFIILQCIRWIYHKYFLHPQYTNTHMYMWLSYIVNTPEYLGVCVCVFASMWNNLSWETID